MRLKIWHNSNLGHLPFFEREVKDVATAIVWINLLWDYDLYHYGPEVPANMSGLLQFNEQTCLWDEWEDSAGRSISMLIGMDREAEAKRITKMKRKMTQQLKARSYSNLPPGSYVHYEKE